MARRTLLRDFMLGNPLYANGSVTFYEADASGAKTATLATLYANESGSDASDQLINPQPLDSEGKFSQDVFFEERMIGVVSGLTVPSHETGVIHTAGSFRGQWATATLYYPGDTVIAGSAADSTNDIYIIDGIHTSGTFATDVSNGELSKMVDVSVIAALFDIPAIGGSDAGKLIQVNATSDGYEIVNTLTGSIIFSGTNTFSGGNTHSGNNTFSGNNTHSGTSKFTGTVTAQGAMNYAAASGTDTYTATIGLTALVAGGAPIYVYFANANTSATPTLNPDGLGAKTIVSLSGGALLYGELNGYHALQYDGTNLRLLNPAKPRFRGALVYKSTSQIVSDATVTSVTFDLESYDTDNIHDTVTNNERLTVPTGVTKIRLIFNLHVSDADATTITNWELLAYKNGSISFVGTPRFWPAYDPDQSEIYVQSSSPVLSVTGGDYFHFTAYFDTSASASISISTNSWFSMEIIE